MKIRDLEIGDCLRRCFIRSNNWIMICPVIVFADEDTHSQEVTIHYDVSKLYEVERTFSYGIVLFERATSLYAEYNCMKQAVFC